MHIPEEEIHYHTHADGTVHAHTHAHTHTQTKSVINRLSRAIGHLESVKRMVEDDEVKCEDIMIQINAADSALHRIGLLILEGHLGHCVRKGIEEGHAEEAIENFTDSLEQYVGIK